GVGIGADHGLSVLGTVRGGEVKGEVAPSQAGQGALWSGTRARVESDSSAPNRFGDFICEALPTGRRGNWVRFEWNRLRSPDLCRHSEYIQCRRCIIDPLVTVRS